MKCQQETNNLNKLLDGFLIWKAKFFMYYFFRLKKN